MVLQEGVGTIVKALGMASETYRPQLNFLLSFPIEEA